MKENFLIIKEEEKKQKKMKMKLPLIPLIIFQMKKQLMQYLYNLFRLY